MKATIIIFALLLVLSLTGCDNDPGTRGLANSIKYVRDKHGIVYAVGYGWARNGSVNTNTFVMTTIPAAEAEKIPKEEITNLSDLKEK